MDAWLDPVLLSRAQFAFIAAFHILWPPLTIGLSLVLFWWETMWLRTGSAYYYRQARFWTRIFVLNFGVGVVSGLPMEFAFGTNWGPFSIATGNFIGNILGFETVLAFATEAGFLGIMVFGWNRVPAPMHLFATGMVVLGGVFSAFWIMVANAWMQTPRGAVIVDGKFVVTDFLEAIFTPDLAHSFTHMFLACIELSTVVMAGFGAWYFLKRRHVDFFLPMFKFAALATAIVAPLQIVVGDLAGSALAEHQSAKLAAVEAHWHTNPPGEGAAWSVIAWPDTAAQENRWALEIPNALSLIVTHSLTGEVKGLRDFPPADQPPVWIPYYAFRVMVAAGVFIALLAIWTLVRWRHGQLQGSRVCDQRWLMRAWIAAIPAVYLALEAGWFVREVGRQPWLVYGLIRTSEGAGTLTTGSVLWSLSGFVLSYAVIGIVAFVFARRIAVEGPDLQSSLPRRWGYKPAPTPAGSVSSENERLS
jgi:cytochrome d ubiquinol oxidase subunit I